MRYRQSLLPLTTSRRFYDQIWRQIEIYHNQSHSRGTLIALHLKLPFSNFRTGGSRSSTINGGSSPRSPLTSPAPTRTTSALPSNTATNNNNMNNISSSSKSGSPIRSRLPLPTGGASPARSLSIQPASERREVLHIDEEVGIFNFKITFLGGKIYISTCEIPGREGGPDVPIGLQLTARGSAGRLQDCHRPA